MYAFTSRRHYIFVHTVGGVLTPAIRIAVYRAYKLPMKRFPPRCIDHTYHSSKHIVATSLSLTLVAALCYFIRSDVQTETRHNYLVVIKHYFPFYKYRLSSCRKQGYDFRVRNPTIGISRLI